MKGKLTRLEQSNSTPNSDPNSYPHSDFDSDSDPDPTIYSTPFFMLNLYSFQGMLEYVKAETPDILCLQETKLHEGSNEIGISFDLTSYPNQYFSNSKISKGYSGTAILSKLTPLRVIYGIPDYDSNDQEGRLIGLEFDSFWVLCSYCPNSGSKLERLDYKLEYLKKLNEYMISLEIEKSVILTGGEYMNGGLLTRVTYCTNYNYNFNMK